MSSLSILLFFLLCLSMHAWPCNGRCLKESGKQGHLFTETSPNDLQLQAKTEGLKSSQGRSMLGQYSSSPHNTEEVVDSKENDIVEDIVVTDYAQPHRKPPIHN